MGGKHSNPTSHINPHLPPRQHNPLAPPPHPRLKANKANKANKPLLHHKDRPIPPRHF
ncbi:uncharacterized protein LY89DRAFT_684328 [Mollisia scopiformis]|uniref:Uncharacterized protein n=1 Tax=Mollisia scopiformis TaxID=149040 RepID=A0A194XE39_MOLSC|nr:uncharacterized protein LY89DRAFT_684328 [Mollisia scopiformis]KUJ18419.1 hypothetical protein LY89DRAFT_684328 [Mollisia scopiformis]